MLNPKNRKVLRALSDCSRILPVGRLFQGTDYCTLVIGHGCLFRVGTFAVPSNIKEMPLQVKLQCKDRNALHFLRWAEKCIYTRAICGVQDDVPPIQRSISAFCTICTLQETAGIREDPNKPAVIEAAGNRVYVESYLGSFLGENTAKGHVIFGRTPEALRPPAGTVHFLKHHFGIECQD